MRQGIAALFGKPYRGLKSFSAILLGLDARFFNRSEMGRRGGCRIAGRGAVGRERGSGGRDRDGSSLSALHTATHTAL